MSLPIDTYTAARGGNVFYKALAHPLATRNWPALRQRLAHFDRLAVYDWEGRFAEVAALLPVDTLNIDGYFSLDLDRVITASESGAELPWQSLDRLPAGQFDAVWIPGFDTVVAERHLDALGVAGKVEYLNLDDLKIPGTGDSRRYLEPLNFATNWAFFRDDENLHTRISGSNYWSRYGAVEPVIHALLFDQHGEVLCEFDHPLGIAGSSWVLDSRDLVERFDLEPFCGQLFIHVMPAAGHDVVKYALDIYSADGTVRSATHDANIWPAASYGGLPGSSNEHDSTLWVQNSHGCTIPPSALTLISPEHPDQPVPILSQPLGPYASREIAVPQGTQWRLDCGKHLARPRYEVTGRTRASKQMAHLNIHRHDLAEDRAYRMAESHLGRGYLLVAPRLDPAQYKTQYLITPMSAAQRDFDIDIRHLAANGELLHSANWAGEASELGWLDAPTSLTETGHVELSYRRGSNTSVDGWLHAIFRYQNRQTGHGAETSFGSHMFNMLKTWRGEPQSYAGPPPGLTTRLQVRADATTFLHLVYPSSLPWHALSATDINVLNEKGECLDSVAVQIACNGSALVRLSEKFSASTLAATRMVQIRDMTCRLFGYHGQVDASMSGAFSLDHLFGA